MTTVRRVLAERLFSSWIWRLPPDSHSLALTFDDGPDPETTPRLLECLERLGIAATLFLVGERCPSNAGVVRAAAHAGHVVANHGFVHTNHRWRGREFQRNSLRFTESAIQEAGVVPARLFRPPFGGFNWFTTPVIRACNHTGILWSLMIKDWVDQSENQLKRKLKAGLHSGAILALHDGHATTHQVIRVLPWLRDEVASRGWRFVTLRHLEPSLDRQT